MKRESGIKEGFLKEVANHQPKCAHSDGLYRHYEFRNTENGFNWFDIITWPWNLTINGDMGCFNFARIKDMFAFFRDEQKQLRINPSYWAEKVTSRDRHHGCEGFDPDYYMANVIASLDGYDLDEDKKKHVAEKLRGEWGEVDECEHELRKVTSDFVYADQDDLDRFSRRELLRSGKEFTLSDPWEIHGNTYSHHYIWNLYAVVWGIQQIDETVTR